MLVYRASHGVALQALMRVALLSTERGIPKKSGKNLATPRESKKHLSADFSLSY
jgi:hypothetical protein